jgi:hypothetical protein
VDGVIHKAKFPLFISTLIMCVISVMVSQHFDSKLMILAGLNFLESEYSPGTGSSTSYECVGSVSSCQDTANANCDATQDCAMVLCD